MTKIKEIIYPITVYSVNEAHTEDGELNIQIFSEPPNNYDSHQIKGNKFIWTIDLDTDHKKIEFFLNKKEAKKIAIKISKDRLKYHQNKVAKLKKQLKDIRSL